MLLIFFFKETGICVVFVRHGIINLNLSLTEQSAAMGGSILHTGASDSLNTMSL